jgi:hypothetical protein
MDNGNMFNMRDTNKYINICNEILKEIYSKDIYDFFLIVALDNKY